MKTSHTTLIRGATFSRAGTIKLPAGTWSVTGSVKSTDGVLISNFICTLTQLGSPLTNGDTHSLIIEVPSTETVNWPVDTLVADLKFNDTSLPPVIIISNRFNILVQQEV